MCSRCDRAYRDCASRFATVQAAKLKMKRARKPQPAVTTGEEVERLQPQEVRWGWHHHRHWGWRHRHLGLASPSLASLAPASLASSPLALLVIGLIIQRLAASKRRGRDRQGVRSDGAGLRQPCGVAQ
jgi:hypothetical protein